MKTANKALDYYDFPIGKDKYKTLHFTPRFIQVLQDVVGEDLYTFLNDSIPKMKPIQEVLATAQIVFSGMVAYDLEKGNEIDYDVYQIRDWMHYARQRDIDIEAEVVKAMTKSFTDMGKKHPKK